MSSSACFPPAAFRNALFQKIHALRGGMRGWLLAAAAALIASVPASTPLQAQTVHYGAVVTLGSGFASPTGVAVDAFGNVFVADNGNSAVKEIMAVNGNIPASPVINTLGSGFTNPFTAAVDGNGNVFVADYGNHAIKEIEAVNGSIPASPTIRTVVSGLSFIFGTATDANGDVFFSEYGKNLVKEIVAADGVIPAVPKMLTLGGGFDIPAGLAVDAYGNVFVGDQNNNAAKEILASSGYTTVDTLSNSFSTPDGIAVDTIGNVYVANDGGNQVDELLAVNGVLPASPVNLILSSSFSQPFDVAVDLNGNVFVADRGNSAVKEIQRSGMSFGPVNVGATSPYSLTLSFTFDVGGTLGSTAVLTQGAPGLDFTDAGEDTCTANTFYNSGAVCTVNVIFSPSAPGLRYGAVELLSTDGALLATGYVKGTGVGPQATFATTGSGTSLPSSESILDTGLNSPGGVAVDGSGNVFVADSGNGVVREILAAGGYSTIHTISGFYFPNGITVDGAGNLYVADTYNQRVVECNAASGFGTCASWDIGFDAPYAVAVDGGGNMYVADFATNSVKEFFFINGIISGAQPTYRTIASGLNGPDGVAVDGNGNVFVANYNDNTVQEIVAVNGSIPTLPTIKTVGSGFSGPSNLSVDASGNVYVSDTNNSEVKEIVAAGGYTTVKILGSGFNSPEAAAVTASGDVVVADSGNNAVEFLDYADAPSLIFASTPVGAISADSPQTVAVTNDGNAPLIFSLPTSGDNPSVSSNFTWAPTSTCVQTTPGSSQPFELAGGANCTVALDFKPATATFISGNATLTDNNLNKTAAVQIIQLSGIGLGSKISQTISFGTIAAQTIGTPLTLTATASSGLAVTYSSLTGSRCTVSGNTATFLLSGTCTIVAEQNGNSIYAAAPEVSQSFTVNKEAQTISFGTIPAQAIGTPLTLTASATSGLAVTFTSITSSRCTVSGATATFTATGTCTIQAMQTGNSTYAAAPTVMQSFTIGKEAQTISFGTIPAQAIGTPLTLAASASSGLAVTYTSITASKCTVSGATATFIATGTCSIEATQTGNATFAAAPMITQSFTVNKEAQTITFANPGTQKVGTQLTLSATASSGLPITYSSVTGSRCTVSGNMATFVEAGTCTIYAEQSGNSTFAAAPNVSQSFTVTAN